MMKRMSFNNPTECQKADVENSAIEEHHAILFLIGADKCTKEIFISKELS